MSAAVPHGRPSSDVLLELEGVGAGYDDALALRDVTFRAAAGDRIAILGPNGGGKTTLFRVVLGELAARTGRLHVAGDVAIVPQTERSRLDFPVTALDVVLMGTIAGRPWWRGPGRADRRAAREALEAVGLGDRKEHRPSELSGGQRQRVAVARALVTNPTILLADEPTGNLDSVTGEEIMHLLETLYGQGQTIILVTHEHDIAAHARRQVHIKDGLIDRDTATEGTTA